MIFRLKVKYKYICAVIIFIVIFFFIILFKTVSFRKCHLDDDNDPIDVVYTWVNGSDPLFLAELYNLSKKLAHRKVDKSKARFFDRYELKFSLRSLEKYAPWIRNVYIVTNGQIPYWLNLDYERVFLISHEDIFIDKHDLPSFSSPGIETHLHRIPGLSKKFIYFNDDIYLGAPVYLDDFYSSGRGYLIYLDYPMQSCSNGCPWIYVHDGQCDKECNVPDCQMDGGDCDITDINTFEPIHNAPSLNVRYLYTEAPQQQQETKNSTILSSQNAAKNLNNTEHFKSAFLHLPPNLEQTSVKRLVDTHNRNKLLEDKIKRKQLISKSEKKKGKSKYFDAYKESLQFTNRLFNTKYGFAPRYVPAHMPFLIDVDVMTALHDKFPKEFEVTSANRFRSRDDIQFAFAYFYFLMEEKIDVGIDEIFDEFDTDLSGTWSDREIRTILTRLHDIPLSTSDIDQFDNLLLNCSKTVHYQFVTTPEYERYIDSVLTTISKELVTHCEELTSLLLQKFSTRSKYKYEIIKNVSKYVTFEMIQSNVQSNVVKLDKIRKNPTKFVCLNDNVYSKRNESTINAIWYDFYVSLFPTPSKFELPSEYRNRFQYIADLKWYQTKMTIYLYGCILLFMYFIMCLLYKNKLIYFVKNKLFY